MKLFFPVLLLISGMALSTVATAAPRLVKSYEICITEENGCMLVSETNTGRVNVDLGPGLAQKLSASVETLRYQQDKYLNYNFYPDGYERAKSNIEAQLGHAIPPPIYLTRKEVDDLREELALDREAMRKSIDGCALTVALCGLGIVGTKMTVGVTLPIAVLTCGASFIQCSSTWTQYKQYQLKLNKLLEDDDESGDTSNSSGGGGDGASGGGPSGSGTGSTDPVSGGSSGTSGGLGSGRGHSTVDEWDSH